MRILFSTERKPAVSANMGDGRAHQGTAWFEFVLHEGPPDDKTWEGGGQTVAYWHTQFARQKTPRPWTVDPGGIKGVEPAVIPDEIVDSLPEDARISMLWTFVRADASVPSA
jgi:hypothetical protein